MKVRAYNYDKLHFSGFDFTAKNSISKEINKNKHKLLKREYLSHIKFTHCKFDDISEILNETLFDSISFGFCSFNQKDFIKHLRKMHSIVIRDSSNIHLPKELDDSFKLMNFECVNTIIEMVEFEPNSLIMNGLNFIYLENNDLGKKLGILNAKNLCACFITKNKLDCFPIDLNDCPNLVDLDLSDNKIKNLPNNLLLHETLRTVKIERNRISDISNLIPYSCPNKTNINYSNSKAMEIFLGKNSISKVNLSCFFNDHKDLFLYPFYKKEKKTSYFKKLLTTLKTNVSLGIDVVKGKKVLFTLNRL